MSAKQPDISNELDEEVPQAPLSESFYRNILPLEQQQQFRQIQQDVAKARAEQQGFVSCWKHKVRMCLTKLVRIPQEEFILPSCQRKAQSKVEMGFRQPGPMPKEQREVLLSAAMQQVRDQFSETSPIFHRRETLGRPLHGDIAGVRRNLVRDFERNASSVQLDPQPPKRSVLPTIAPFELAKGHQAMPLELGARPKEKAVSQSTYLRSHHLGDEDGISSPRTGLPRILQGHVPRTSSPLRSEDGWSGPDFTVDMDQSVDRLQYMTLDAMGDVGQGVRQKGMQGAAADHTHYFTVDEGSHSREEEAHRVHKSLKSQAIYDSELSGQCSSFGLLPWADEKMTDSRVHAAREQFVQVPRAHHSFADDTRRNAERQPQFSGPPLKALKARTFHPSPSYGRLSSDYTSDRSESPSSQLTVQSERKLSRAQLRERSRSVPRDIIAGSKVHNTLVREVVRSLLKETKEGPAEKLMQKVVSKVSSSSRYKDQGDDSISSSSSILSNHAKTRHLGTRAKSVARAKSKK